MSAVSQAQQIPRLAHTGRVTQLRVALSEWTKLRSLRSTLWSLFAGVLLTILLPVLFAAITSSHWGSMSPHERADRHPLDIALAGVNVSQLAIAVLGVLVITGEYSTGMIRSTMLAVPKRLRHFLERDAELQGAALRLFLRAVEQCLRAHSPGSAPGARCWARLLLSNWCFSNSDSAATARTPPGRSSLAKVTSRWIARIRSSRM